VLFYWYFDIAMQLNVSKMANINMFISRTIQNDKKTTTKHDNRVKRLYLQTYTGIYLQTIIHRLTCNYYVSYTEFKSRRTIAYTFSG